MHGQLAVVVFVMAKITPCLPTILKKAAQTLGYTSLKKEQEEAVTSFVAGRDVFVSLPTGYGKTLCFALVYDAIRGLEKKSIVIIISPLTAIMKDQVESFNAKGITACAADHKLRQDIKNGKFQLVFISPEGLFCTLEWRQMLCTETYRSNLVGIIVDEAHCIKKWGDTFRKQFSRIGELRSFVSEDVKVMAVTATATQSTRKIIFKTLNMHLPKIIYIKPVRRNITFAVTEKSTIEKVFSVMVDQLSEMRTSMGRIIIYCKKYSDVASIYHYFKKSMGENFTEPKGAADLSRYRLVEMYTHCTQEEVKTTIVRKFTAPSSLRVVIGTIAFGMGINSPDVRQIIHWGVSDDCEMYVQESGRAGRDGLQSCAVIYYGQGDLNKKYVSSHMIDYCTNKGKKCRREVLFQDFDDCLDVRLDTLCLCCDSCGLHCNCGKCSSNLGGFCLFPSR